MLINLWRCIDRINIKAESKLRLFSLALEIPAGMSGILIWLVIRIWCLRTLDWLVCFIGYPAVTAWIIAILFTYSHEFHDSSIS